MQNTLTIGDHTFVAIDSPADDIGASKWNTRGWTYQECLLSRRRLVFTDSQVYFQCLTTHCLEGLESVYPDSIPAEYLCAFPKGFIWPEVHKLYDRLEDYYPRQLSYSTDIINAFAGIFDAFSHLNVIYPARLENIFGIPYISSRNPEFRVADAFFALGLAWKIDGICVRDIDDV